MPEISVQLAENPTKLVLAFSPRGGKIRVKVRFPRDSIPEEYRMQIIDSRNNARLNRYGKGSEEGITLDWPIPRIREVHHGTWQVKVESDTVTFNEHFFVYPHELSILPMLPAGPDVVDAVPEEETILPAKEAIPVHEEVGEREVTEELLVTAIKGIGKTFANRLANYDIHTVIEFVNYPDRTYLGEIMRISDSRLEKMIDNGRSLLEKGTVKEKMVEITEPAMIIETAPQTIESPEMDLVAIPGIGPKTASRLARYDIRTVSGFVNFSDRTYLGEIMRISDTRLAKMLEKARRMLGEEGMIEPGIQDIPGTIPDTVEASINSLLDTPGIGPKTINKLTMLGINSPEDLVRYKDAETLRKTLRMSKQRFNEFISTLQVAKRDSYEQKSDDHAVGGDEPDNVNGRESLLTLNNIKGVGPKTVDKLNTVGIHSLDDLIKVNPSEISPKIKISVKKLETWQNAAISLRN
ncbi:MAG: helix-hairpin-helix domain-containing protein [Candidatus Hodarchaeales archaeon]